DRRVEAGEFGHLVLLDGAWSGGVARTLSRRACARHCEKPQATTQSRAAAPTATRLRRSPRNDSLAAMISIRQGIAIASPPDAVWPLLSDPATVASCIPGATLTKTDDGGKYQGTMRVKFGPTVAQFRGEAKLAYDHDARRCTIEGRGIDGRGASRA